MKNGSFLIITLSTLLFWSFIPDNSSEWETDLLQRIYKDQDLSLQPYLMDYQVIDQIGKTDTLVLFLTVEANPDQTSTEMLFWNLRCTKTSNTAAFVERKYDGGCKENGVIVPSELKLGTYYTNTKKAEVLCGDNHYMTIDCNGI